nr:transposase [Bacteroidales bacterium]
NRKNVLPKSPIGKAFDYCLARWDSLLNYLKDGNLLIDNNLIENAIRPLALGRKNYLFAGSHDAAEDIAMYYSFFATCKKNDLNPKKWLTYVIEHINNYKISQLHNLLPHFFDKSLLN